MSLDQLKELIFLALVLVGMYQVILPIVVTASLCWISSTIKDVVESFKNYLEVSKEGKK